MYSFIRCVCVVQKKTSHSTTMRLSFLLVHACVLIGASLSDSSMQQVSEDDAWAMKHDCAFSDDDRDSILEASGADVSFEGGSAVLRDTDGAVKIRFDIDMATKSIELGIDALSSDHAYKDDAKFVFTLSAHSSTPVFNEDYCAVPLVADRGDDTSCARTDLILYPQQSKFEIKCDDDLVSSGEVDTPERIHLAIQNDMLTVWFDDDGPAVSALLSTGVQFMDLSILAPTASGFRVTKSCTELRFMPPVISSVASVPGPEPTCSGMWRVDSYGDKFVPVETDRVKMVTTPDDSIAVIVGPGGSSEFYMKFDVRSAQSLEYEIFTPYYGTPLERVYNLQIRGASEAGRRVFDAVPDLVSGSCPRIRQATTFSDTSGQVQYDSQMASLCAATSNDILGRGRLIDTVVGDDDTTSAGETYHQNDFVAPRDDVYLKSAQRTVIIGDGLIQSGVDGIRESTDGADWSMDDAVRSPYALVEFSVDYAYDTVQEIESGRRVVRAVDPIVIIFKKTCGEKNLLEDMLT